MPPPRSDQTCHQCRVRKVRCKGRGPGEPCADCDRLGFPCAFTTRGPSSLASDPPQQPARKRGPKACVQCREHKAKCSGELPSCSSCVERGSACEYRASSRTARATARRLPSRSVAAATATGQHETSSPDQSDLVPRHVEASPAGFASDKAASSTEQSWQYESPHASRIKAGEWLPLPPMKEQLQLVNDFFRHLYPQPVYSFLCEVAITQRCLDRTLDKPLLLGICASSAMYLNYVKYHPVFTQSWVKQAEEIIWDRISQPSIFLTQALMLVVCYRVQTGDFERAFMLASLTGRSATALRLQYERLDLSLLAQEIRRRLMWCIVLLDGHFSLGLREAEMCPLEAVYLDPPGSEEDFTADPDASSMPLDGVPEDGLLGYIVRNLAVRRDIMRLKRQLSLAAQPWPGLEAVVAGFEEKLDSMRPLPYSTAQLTRYAQSRWLVRYLSVQMAWHQCHCDLYRHFLPGYAEAAPEVVLSALSTQYLEQAARACHEHAHANLTILRDLAATATDSFVGDFDLAVCAYHAARLVLHMSRRSQYQAFALPPDQASSMAQTVHDLLPRLAPGSRLVEKMGSSLEAIIRAHGANQGEPSGASSESEERESNTQSRGAPLFAMAAKQHQNLGVHSILRQTRFMDDSHRASDEPRGQQPSRSSTMLRASSGGGDSTVAASFDPSLLGGPLDVELPCQLSADSLNLGFDEAWTWNQFFPTGGYPSANADGDFF
ncbi:3-dehydroquinate dehydratase I [Emericellopsis cladophorae]|uniref:3-dehydroquinate dehydratase I n=1 Tax=Emericellopsis cladophorae TaxID=2686198 RepID=A0A9P9XWY7_9HYPO|nr:3-dehydroquinate dehydratase I [Emericellopsis cladophorae]KAI6779366.1 3-dehydroquinate dehydratase I [Emericellopsis cladophorae]